MPDLRFVKVITLMLLTIVSFLVQSLHGRSPSCPYLKLPYGRVSYQNEQRTAKFACNTGFRMFGKSVIQCWNGVWKDFPPICFSVEPGCPIIRQIANGRVFQSQENGIVAVHCNVGYERKGSHVMFCNGTKWNDTIPVCNEKMKEIPRPISTKSKMIDLSLQNDATNNGINCTFDIGGTCGWIQETSSVYRWTVQNASPNSTSTIGPLHDVTSGSSVQTGRYLFARPTTSGLPTDTARLLSPIVTPTQSGSFCLSFWYYLSGIRPRSLSAGLVPFASNDNRSAEIPLIQLTDDQGDRWSQIRVPFYESSPFRLIFEVARGVPYAADVAVDDVELSESACSSNSSGLNDTAANTGNEPIEWNSVADDDDLTQQDLTSPSTDLQNSTNGAFQSASNSSEEISVENSAIDIGLKVVNIDIYEKDNKSYVDEPAQFKVQVIHPHDSTINPTHAYLSYLNANNESRTSSLFSNVSTGKDNNHEAGLGQIIMYVGIGFGLAILSVIIVGAVGVFIWRKRRIKAAENKDPAGTEETEFQYFSYNNEAFHEAVTLPVGKKKSVKK